MIKKRDGKNAITIGNKGIDANKLETYGWSNIEYNRELKSRKINKMRTAILML